MYTVIDTKAKTTNTYQKTDDISDGYHTFGELYEYRCQLFKVITRLLPEHSWKSRLHSDGTMFNNMFIVGITTPEGDFAIHVEGEFFDEFTCKEIEKAPEWDGHTMKDVDRLLSLGGLK